MRKCFLHVGTHKTGTSSIQNTLDDHRDDLAKHGFLYPRVGPFPSHSNIAWELAGHELFQQKNGTVDGLIEQIRASTQNVILSSEDFILAFPKEAFRSFIERLKQSQLEITILVYLRDPPDYFRSAYFEILKADCPFGFGPFISAMTDKKAIRWGSHYAGGIDVIDHLQQLATDKDIRMVARSYDRVKKSVVADFLSVIGLTPGDLGLDQERWDNPRTAIGNAFSLFYQNRTGHPPDENEAWLISCLADALDGREIHMSRPARRMLLASYEDQNQFLKRYGGIEELAEPEKELDDSISVSDLTPSLEEVFSEATVRFIERAALRLAGEFQVREPVQPVEVAPVVTQAANEGQLSRRRRMWYQIKPFVPPALVNLGRSFYYRKSRLS